MDYGCRGFFLLVFASCFLPLTALCENGSFEMGVRNNSEFKISLESNPSTGYKWEAKFDGNFLKLEGDTFNRPSDARIGQGGTQTFVFLPVKAGETTIEFLYKRPWEKETAKTKQYKIRIKQ
jgi:inhibitor of cysteine peptidase